MKSTAVAALAIIPSIASAQGFPDYEANEACGDMVAAQVSAGDVRSDEMGELLVFCRMGFEMFKPTAKGMWDRASAERRSECMEEAEAKAEETGTEYVWYGHLTQCLAPEREGKGDRMPG